MYHKEHLSLTYLILIDTENLGLLIWLRTCLTISLTSSGLFIKQAP